MPAPEPNPTTLSDLLPTTPDGREERLAELRRLFPDLSTNDDRLGPGELKRLVEPNPLRPRAFGGKGDEGIKKGFSGNQ